MNSILENILKLGNQEIANKKCEECVFKVLDYEDDPCFSCKSGKYCGTQPNFVKVENDR